VSHTIFLPNLNSKMLLLVWESLEILMWSSMIPLESFLPLVPHSLSRSALSLPVFS
jgi:hypothetical protein